MRNTRIGSGCPKAIKSMPRSRRLYEAISAAARNEFMSRGAWMLKLASERLGVPDSDDAATKAA